MMRNKGFAVRALSLILAVIMLCFSLASCAARVKEPVLQYNGQKISLSTYEFMLSRMKGTLARNKFDVSGLSTFWSEESMGVGITNEEYYNNSILESCKNYLAALILFEEEGLSLTDSDIEAIEEEIGFYIDYDCGGSEEKFDAILNKYGADTKSLRQIYELEAKYKAVLLSLYGANASQISDTVKDEYYNQNYYRFKQVLVSNFYYEFMTDDEGNMIYFDPETSKPVYDTENGVFVYDDEGYRVKDSYGNTIYYDLDGNILYDKEKGYPAPKTDEAGNAITHKYSDEEMAERVEKMNSLVSTLSDGDYSGFETAISDWRIYKGAEEYYTDGYYLSDLEASRYEEYMLDILEKLKEMEVGETAVVESENGYHVIMKYKLDDKKYSDSNYSEWFASFTDSLITKLFLDRCAKFYSDIEVNEKNLSKAKSIRTIGANYDY